MARSSGRAALVKEATTKRYHGESRRRLDPFLDASNHARRPKTLKGLILVQFI